MSDGGRPFHPSLGGRVKFIRDTLSSLVGLVQTLTDQVIRLSHLAEQLEARVEKLEHPLVVVKEKRR